MTHETKVGIIVACSFLGLVGVVLTLKMKEGSNLDAAPEAEMPAWGEPTPVSPQDATAQTVVPAPTASIPGPGPVPAVPSAPAPQTLHEEILRTSGRDDARPGTTPAPVGSGSIVFPPGGTETVPHGHQEFVGPPEPPAGSITTDPSPPVIEPRPMAASEPAPGPAAPRAPAMPGRDEVVVSPTARAEAAPREGAPLVMPPPPPATAGTTPPATASGSVAATAGPSSPGGAGLPDPTTNSGAPGSSTQTAAPASPPPSSVTAPSVTIGPPDGGRAPGSPPGVMPVHPVPSAPAADTMPEASVRPESVGQVVSPSAVAAGGLPPLGAPAAVATPAITPAVPLPGAAKVQSYDVEHYQWKPGDTFAAVAQQYYHNPKYERALLLFNRDEPMAAKGLMTDAQVPQVNEVIFIPPAKILENRYSSAIPDLSPLPAPGSAVPGAVAVTPSSPVAPLPGAAVPGAVAPAPVAPPPGSPVAPAPFATVPGGVAPGSVAPSPVSPVAPPPGGGVPGVVSPAPVAPPPSSSVAPLPGAAAPGSVAPPPSPMAPLPGAVAPGAVAPAPPPGGAVPVTVNSAPRNYQVQAPDGEMMYRIAEQQLGKGNRWMEIHDLNPTWQPAQPVPVGTVLRLPAQ
jgi:hypothetical protein